MNYPKIIYVIILLLKTTMLSGFGIDLLSSPIIISNAEIYLLSKTPETTFYQPAKQDLGFSLSHSNPHSFRELNVFHLASQITFQKELFSLGLLVLDNNHISDKTLYLGYSKKFNNLSLGSNVKYYNQSVSGYSTLDTFTLNMGAIWNVNTFTHGFTYSNITNTSKSGINLHTVVKYECMITPIDTTKFAVSFEKERYFDMRYAFAVSHNINNLLVLSTGFISNPNQFSAGLLFIVSNLEISVGIKTHQYLRLTQAIGLVYKPTQL